MVALKKTPFNKVHHALKAQLMDFAGWELPAWYTSLVEEHRACRTDKAMWDVSDMGRVWVTGQDASAFLDKLLTKPAQTLAINAAQLCMLLLNNGCVLDDLWLYRLGTERYLIVWNAADIPQKTAWLHHWFGTYSDVTINDVSLQTAMLAVQGPNIPKLKLLEHVADLPRFAPREVKIANMDALIARTGYTGEDGFEIMVAKADALELWQAFMDEGVKPCGLGCRDSLRMEAGMMLNGQDMRPDINALEAGLGWLIKFNGHDFIGKEALMEIKEKGLSKKLVGFKMLGREIARSGYKVVRDGKAVGSITSGGPSPTLGINIGFAYVPIDMSELGTEIVIMIRNKPVKAVITKKKFYTRGK